MTSNMSGYNDHNNFNSRPAACGYSTFENAEDHFMAARQRGIDSLPARERAKKETWAQKQLRKNSGECVAGFAWFRVRGGYRCEGGNHMVTDTLLEEGRGGYYYNSRLTQALKMGCNQRQYRWCVDNPLWTGPTYQRWDNAKMLRGD